MCGTVAKLGRRRVPFSRSRMSPDKADQSRQNPPDHGLRLECLPQPLRDWRCCGNGRAAYGTRSLHASCHSFRQHHFLNPRTSESCRLSSHSGSGGVYCFDAWRGQSLLPDSARSWALQKGVADSGGTTARFGHVRTQRRWYRFYVDRKGAG